MKASEAYEAIRGMLWIWDSKRDTPIPAVKPSVEDMTRDGIWTEEEAIADLALWDQEAEDRSARRCREQALAARFIRALLDPAMDDPSNPDDFEIPDHVLADMEPIPLPLYDVFDAEPPKRGLRLLPKAPWPEVEQ